MAAEVRKNVKDWERRDPGVAVSNVNFRQDGLASEWEAELGLGPAAAGAGSTRENVGRINEVAVKAKPIERRITEQNRQSANERALNIRRATEFMKQGFTKQVHALTASIRESQERIAQGVTQRFVNLKGTLASMKANLATMSESERRNALALEHRMLTVEREIGEVRAKIGNLLRDMETMDEARFREAKNKLEEYNNNVERLAAGLTQGIQDAELRLAADLGNMSEMINNLGRNMRAGFQAASLDLENKLRALRLELTNPAVDPLRLPELRRRLRDLETANEDVEIYICRYCGSSRHGANCVSFDRSDTRIRYKIKRVQLQTLMDGGVRLGRNDEFGEAYFVDVGHIAGETAEDKMRRFIDLMGRHRITAASD